MTTEEPFKPLQAPLTDIDLKKPRAYPDQNILSRLAFGELPVLQKLIDDLGIKLCLSYTHFDEISQIEILEKQELIYQYILKNEIYYLEQHIGTENAGIAVINESNLTAFIKKPSNDPIIDSSVALMQQFAHKSFGGQKSKTHIEIVEEIKNNLTHTLNTEAKQIFDDFISELQKHSFFSNTDSKVSDEIWNVLSMKKSELSKITQPNVIKNIWELVKNDVQKTDPNMTLEQFIGLSFDPNYTLQNKISILMYWLNIIGYWSDKKLDKENKYTASSRDVQHATHASFTGLVISQDDRFCKKLAACFEYLNIKTQILQRLDIHSTIEKYELIWPLDSFSSKNSLRNNYDFSDAIKNPYAKSSKPKS
ncbi:MAG: hypothetical protein GX801_09070 [Fibrobacter sp.]|nr:hypothetical protein [Fibrobacter sp.]